MKKLIALAFILISSSLKPAYAQVSENTKLFKEVMELDSQIFDLGFNQCKMEVFEKYTADDLEFFHDKGGMQNRREFLQAVKQNVCSRPNDKPLRTLVAGSSKVFALEKDGVLYGALQQGVHQFHTKGTDPAVAGYTVAKFTHIWLLRDGHWKLKTSISFDHQNKSGKTTVVAPAKKPVPQLKRLFQLSIASYTWSFYFHDLGN